MTFGAWKGVTITRIPSERTTSSNDRLNCVSRSRMRNRTGLARSVEVQGEAAIWLQAWYAAAGGMSAERLALEYGSFVGMGGSSLDPLPALPRTPDRTRHKPRHLDRILRIYVRHYNRRRPHRGLELEVPERLAPVEEADRVPDIERRDLLGGLVHEYRRAA